MIDINNFIQSQLIQIEESHSNNKDPLILKGMLFTLTQLIEEAGLMDTYFKNYMELENKINTLLSKKVA